MSLLVLPLLGGTSSHADEELCWIFFLGALLLSATQDHATELSPSTCGCHAVTLGQLWHESPSHWGAGKAVAKVGGPSGRVPLHAHEGPTSGRQPGCAPSSSCAFWRGRRLGPPRLLRNRADPQNPFPPSLAVLHR